jgi:mono/diheme cytochrome c family protein
MTVLVVAWQSADSRAQTNASIWDGIYTEAQAARGKALFGDQCGMCHGDPPTGGGMGPPLMGSDFLENWYDLSAGDLFTKVSMTMPANDPGSLMPGQVADIIAYIALNNKWPAGDKELPSALDALTKIKILKK